MPLAPLVATQLTTPVARSTTLFIGGRDFTNSFDISSASIEDSGSSARSMAHLRLRTSMVSAPEITDQAKVELFDHDDDVTVFQGFIRSRHPVTGMNPMLELAADHISSLLDDSWVGSAIREPESMQSRIGYLWGMYASSFLSGDLSNVANIGGTLPAQELEGLTLRQAIEAVLSQASASAQYYVDSLGKLYVFTALGTFAPYDVVVGTPAGGEIAPEDLDIDYDSTTYYNMVWVQGATPAGTGFVHDFAAIAAANGLVRSGQLSAPDCTTNAMAISLGQMYLGRVAHATARGGFSTSSPYDGWRAGQSVAVTEPDIGLAAEPFKIARVTTTFQKTQTGFRRVYNIEFGATRAWGV